VSAGSGILAVSKPRTPTGALAKRGAAVFTEGIACGPESFAFAFDENVRDRAGLRHREKRELFLAACGAAVNIFSPKKVIDVA